MISTRGDSAEDVVAAVSVLTVATVALFLVSLVAAASFVVVAQRRLRQLGMLAAVGATEKHIRLVMVANGAVAGAVAAVARSRRRRGRLDRPRPTGRGTPSGTGSTPSTCRGGCSPQAGCSPSSPPTGAAWWPARTMARIPPVLALSGRPPRPAPAHRSAALAGFFIVGGVTCLAVAGDVVDNTGDASLKLNNALLVAAGTLVIVIGVLLVSPLAIRLLAGGATRLPIAGRLALRDLGRYQARSGAALAAISLALGIPVAVVVTAAAAEHTADAGNLSDRQLIVGQAGEEPGQPPLVPEPAALANLQAGVDRLAASLDDPTVTALDVAVNPDFAPEPRVAGRVPIELVEPDGRWLDADLYVATPALLARYGVDFDAIDPDTEILTVETSDLAFNGNDFDSGTPEMVTNVQTLTPAYSSLPGSFITLEGLQRRGWEPAASGHWLVETSEPLTSDQLATVRDIAAAAGLTDRGTRLPDRVADPALRGHRRRHAVGPRHPRHDRRIDPQRSRGRRPHSDGDRSVQRHPPHPHRRHRRRARPARRRSRHRRRLRRRGRRIRRRRRPHPDPRRPPRRDRHRHTARRRRRRLAPRRPRTGRHRQTTHRIRT